MSKLLYDLDESFLGQKIYVRLYDDHVEISKPANTPGVTPWVKRSIPLFEIEKVEVKPAGGILASGIIQFFVAGESTKKANMLNVSQLDNCLNFPAKFNKIAQDMKAYIDEYNR